MSASTAETTFLMTGGGIRRPVISERSFFSIPLTAFFAASSVGCTSYAPDKKCMSIQYAAQQESDLEFIRNSDLALIELRFLHAE